jgi:hypothetical protein
MCVQVSSPIPIIGTVFYLVMRSKLEVEKLIYFWYITIYCTLTVFKT